MAFPTVRCGFMTLTKILHLNSFAYGMYSCDSGISLRRIGMQIRYWDNSTGHDQELLSDPKLLSLPQRQIDCIVTPNGTTISEFLKTMVKGREDPFFAVDLGRVLRLHKQWKRLLPRVDVFYGEAQDIAIVLLTMEVREIPLSVHVTHSLHLLLAYRHSRTFSPHSTYPLIFPTDRKQCYPHLKLVLTFFLIYR